MTPTSSTNVPRVEEEFGGFHRLYEFFKEWSKLVVPALRPGGHLVIATNTFLSQLVYSALVDGGLEYRGEMIRLIRTLRGGDRPKNADKEFPNVSVIPKGCFEPWGLFRKSLPPKMTVAECLRKFQTGGLRRHKKDSPVEDVIQSERTPRAERSVAKHPSLKPQSFLRHIVFTILPLGDGLLVDPFMGSGSTIAAAESLGMSSMGIEVNEEFFEIAKSSIPKLTSHRKHDGSPRVTRHGKSSSSPSSQTHFELHLP
jgi:site-specific DNA-methyltransferase (adenine-specific)